jgi:hypothetical protein
MVIRRPSIEYSHGFCIGWLDVLILLLQFLLITINYNRRMSSGMWRCVDPGLTDVSEKLIASIFRVENLLAGNHGQQMAADGPYSSPLCCFPMWPTLHPFCSYITGCFRLVTDPCEFQLGICTTYLKIKFIDCGIFDEFLKIYETKLCKLEWYRCAENLLSEITVSVDL